jgi:hypothetical protein
LKTSLVLFASVVIGFILFLVLGGVARGDISRELPWDAIIPAVWALNMLLVFGLMGYYLQFERLYYIGTLYAIVLPLDFLLDRFVSSHIAPYLFLSSGLIIILVGIIYMRRFLQNYPVLGEDA